MARLSNYNAPNWVTAQRASRASCGHDVFVGELITYVPATKAVRCNTCSHRRAQELEAQRARQLNLELEEHHGRSTN